MGICCMAQETQAGALYQPRGGIGRRWEGGSLFLIWNSWHPQVIFYGPKDTNFELGRISSGSGIGVVILILILWLLYNKQMSKYIDIIENMVHSEKGDKNMGWGRGRTLWYWVSIRDSNTNSRVKNMHHWEALENIQVLFHVSPERTYWHLNSHECILYIDFGL